MRRDLKRRLAQAEMAAAARIKPEQEAARHRQSLRYYVKFQRRMREFLALMGIDPALATALRRGEEAEAELAEIPDTPELEAADAAILPPQNSNVDDKAYRECLANFDRMVEFYRSGEQPDFADASPIELWAYCIAAAKEAWGDEAATSAFPDWCGA
jgi:hypothetical protein